jgi:flavorubredoxin
MLGADMVEIKPTEVYEGPYDDVVSEGEHEVQAKVHRAIEPLGVNLADYTTLIVGSPTWWYTMAPAVLTFLSDNDFRGKTVVPFMTNAGWPGTVIKDMTALAEANGAKVTHPKEIRFKSYSNVMQTPQAEVDRWIESI